jgi:hypothetical protein
MTTTIRNHYKIRKVRSLHDLEIEKARLKTEAVKREEQIKGNYRNIVEALTLRNLLQHLSNEISMTTSAVSTAFSVGKTIFEKFKKKKKNKDKIPAAPSANVEINVE